MGYILEDTIYHIFFKERQSDFWEMNLHHFCTLSLYGGMILQNFITVGMVISWIHSLADVWTSMARVFSQTTFKLSTIVSFAIAILTWMYTRTYWVPVVTYNSWQSVIYPEELSQYQMAPNILNSFLVCLCVLHYYWLTLFLNIFIGGIRSGDTDNKQNRSIEKKAKEIEGKTVKVE